MFEKKFQDWSLIKEKLHDTDRTNTTFKERDVWWCSIGCNIGDEIDGKSVWFNRPVLVLRKFNRNIFYGVPLSTKNKQNKYYLTFTFQGRQVSALLSHMRLYDKKRFQIKMGQLDTADYKAVKKAMRELFA